MYYSYIIYEGLFFSPGLISPDNISTYLNDHNKHYAKIYIQTTFRYFILMIRLLKKSRY